MAPTQMHRSQLAWLALSRLPGLGGKRCLDLVEHFGSPQNALELMDAWHVVVGPGVARKACHAGIDWSWAAAQLQNLERGGGHLLTPDDRRYPYLLRQIHQLPPVLFVLGEIPESMPCVSLVGTRRATEYGLAVARRLAAALTRAGVCVVSGLAHGIDGAAHQGALEAGGKTLAVLGCGVDVIYPAHHARLYRQIRQSGAVISEFPMGSAPEPGSFPRRNRIISGLSLGVVVVEAPARSGALITTTYAAEQGRDVFAVPGDVRRGKSAGCHALLRDGAKLVERVEDILEEMGTFSATEAVTVERAPELAADLAPREKHILAHLEGGEQHVDALAEAVGLELPLLLDALLKLELAGLVDQRPGKRFVRAASIGV